MLKWMKDEAHVQFVVFYSSDYDLTILRKQEQLEFVSTSNFFFSFVDAAVVNSYYF